MLKLGIIGTGRLGSFHAEKAAANPDVELVGVADPSVTARNLIAKKFGVEAFASFDTLLPKTDAVIIASPTFLHYSIASIAIQSGKHVLLEKPMCGTLPDARKLVDMARRNKTVLQAGHVEEFNPAWQTAKKSLSVERQENLPMLINAVRSSGYTFRSTDVGTVFDMMIHDIDLVLSLTASHVFAVDAVGFRIIGGQHEDTAHARLIFDNGSVANLYSSRIAPAAKREMQITTALGTLSIDFAKRTTVAHRPNTLVLQGEYAPNRILPDTVPLVAPEFMKDSFDTEVLEHESVDALAEELKDFVLSIETGKTPRVSGSRALEAVSVAETIVHSIGKYNRHHIKIAA
ncbi:MAG: Gfo/Idh/MocA family oxidoreductase [Planctomycetaceae bacterium]|jgi:predicted dehydrogenase|nr:Gfo/Idh/MocA family oxidoreductase [Planctomycetaceae bacterium]